MQVAYEEIHVGGKGRRAVAVRPLASLGSPVAVPWRQRPSQRKENQARSERPARKSARSRARSGGCGVDWPADAVLAGGDWLGAVD